MTKDLTKGNPAKLILYFSIPLLIGNLFQQFYSMADTFIVGRTISVDALAAVGCTGSISFFIIGFAQGLTAGFSIITAQRFGANDLEGMRKSVVSSSILSAVITVILTAVSVSLARPILVAMNTPSNLLEDAVSYISVIFWGIVTSVLFNLLSNIIRALGDSVTPLIFLVIACILNIILDYVCILVFHMGVAGAGWATVVSQLFSGLLCLVYIGKKLPILHLRPSDWKVGWSFHLDHLKVGLPMAFQTSIIAIGSIALQSALNNLGSTAVAAYTAAQKIDNLAVQPMASFGVTMATYTAQNYGAGDMQRIRRGVRQCGIISVIFSILAALIVILAGRFFVGLFVGSENTEVIDLAMVYLVINGAMYFVLALLFVYRNALQGLGKTFVPTLAGVMELLMRIFVAFTLASTLGFAGACMANPAAWIGATIPLAIAYFTVSHQLKKYPPAPLTMHREPPHISDN